jgi:hypothetical protein
MDLVSLFGWIPALVFPGATALQLIAILRARSAQGVSVLAWLLFGIANVSLYVYVGKHGEVQAILSGLGTALLNFAIVVAALTIGKAPTPQAPSGSTPAS